MATTVNQAFDEFMKNKVNLDSTETANAKSSRKWLMDQLNGFGDTDNTFPKPYLDNHIYYGSFSRRTKKRPLDDIDIMFCMTADGCTYIRINGRIEITTPDAGSRFSSLVHDGTNLVNSTKVINKFKAKLNKVPQYKNADIGKDGEAVVLDLSSYTWAFDILPCFITADDAEGNNFYVIPDGKGHWKKTDPRLDAERLDKINKSHNGLVLNSVRLMKYWNGRATMPDTGSYLLENMILDYYASATVETSKYVDSEFIRLLKDLHSRIFQSVNDPKNIEGDLNKLLYVDRKKISNKAASDHHKAVKARDLETAGKNKESIELWGELFGDEFPKFG